MARHVGIAVWPGVTMFRALSPDRDICFRDAVENACSQSSANENRGFLRSGRSTLPMALSPHSSTSSIPSPWHFSPTLGRDCCSSVYPKLHLILTVGGGGQKTSFDRKSVVQGK